MSSWREDLDRALVSLGGGFGLAASDHLDVYIDALCKWDATHNLTAESGASGIVKNLVIPSVFVAERLSGYGGVLDLGTGAGVPGLIAAIIFREQRWFLVERAQKKVGFLKQMVQCLGLKNVTVLCRDFRDLAVDESIDALVTRGSAKLPGQVALTGEWRGRGVPLFSVQTKKSLEESGLESGCEQQDMPALFSRDGLMLVKVK